MKKIVMLFLCFASAVNANTSFQEIPPDSITDAGRLGLVAGIAYACQSKNLKNYELISSRIIANSAPTKAIEKQNMKEYVIEKLASYKRYQQNPQISCQEFEDIFRNMPIFKSVVYKSGAVLLPDGVLLKNRNK